MSETGYLEIKEDQLKLVVHVCWVVKSPTDIQIVSIIIWISISLDDRISVNETLFG